MAFDSRRWLAFILIIYGSFSATAQPIPGFYQPEMSLVPPAVAAAARASVYEIVFFDLNPVKTVNLKEKQQEGVDVEELIRAQAYSEKLKQMLIERIRFCRAKAFLETCALYAPSERTSAGTAYLLGDGSTLWTDYHVIDGFVEQVAAKWKRPVEVAYLTLEHQNLPFALFNSEGKLVFMSNEDDKAQVIEKPFDHHGIKLPLDNSYRPSSDLVKIKLPRAVGRPLKLAAKLPEPGEPVYGAGYPTATGMRSSEVLEKYPALVTRHPYKDSPGDQLVVSIGAFLDQREGLNRIHRNNKLPEISDLEFALLKARSYFNFGLKDDPIDLTQVVFLDLDVVFGNSGGPALNSAGEAFAMNGSIDVEYGDGGKYFRTTTRAVNMITVVRKLNERK